MLNISYQTSVKSPGVTEICRSIFNLRFGVGDLVHPSCRAPVRRVTGSVFRDVTQLPFKKPPRETKQTCRERLRLNKVKGLVLRCISMCCEKLRRHFHADCCKFWWHTSSSIPADVFLARDPPFVVNVAGSTQITA